MTGVFLATALGAAGGFVAPTDAEIDRVLGELSDSPMAMRLLHLSGRFRGAPYVDSPLGEGAGLDPDPLVRYDAVDCLTYVEEVVALARARSAAEAAEVLQRIRYAGDAVRFEERNHFVEAQWLPNALRRGFLREITRAVGGADVVETAKEVTAETWRRRRLGVELRLPDHRAPIGRVVFPMIPLTRVPERLSEVSPGAVLVVIRKDYRSNPTRVTHLGFVVRRGGRTYLRHAARTFGRVTDEEVGAFLARHGAYTRWPVDGVRLFEVTGTARDAGPTAAGPQPPRMVP